MAKPFPLQTLLDLSQLRMDDAARQLGELLAGEQEAGARLILLQEYRAEYHERFAVALRNGIGRDAWNNFQAFLGRLDDAIAQAHALVLQSKQRTAAGQREWVDKRGRVQAFDTLSQRHHNREQSAANRQEQKAQDEHAARNRQGLDGED
ncbi:MAG: flagellar export protein FliJ [Betaproteobacteria bacterium]|nr:flagellar export protein FliJ [Betaproteobacteria bacterium]